MYSSAGRLGTVILGLLLVAALASPAAAHGNYLAVDSQVSADGTVRIEGTFLVTTGYVVLHADDAGDIGEVLGHVKPDTNEFFGELSVAINQTYWADVSGSMPIWAVLHYDADNDGSFQAADDPPIGGHDDPGHAVRLHVARDEQPAYVLAEREHAQKTNTSTVTIRRVHLPEEGYLVVRSNANGEPGDVIGNRSLSAGLHVNVSVSIDEHAYHHRPDQFSLWAVVYRSDGTGTFDGGDRPILVNGTPVASQFQVERTGDVDADHDHTPSATGTAVSPSPMEETEHEHEHGEASETPGPSTQPTASATEPQQAQDATTSTPGQPGLGILTTLLALVLAFLAANRRTS